MRYFERRAGLHLTVLAAVVAAVIAALAIEGIGLAVIVAIGCFALLGIGFPLLAILSEEHELPMARKRDRGRR